MRFLRMKADCLISASLAAVLTISGMIVWEHHKFKALEGVIIENSMTAFTGPGALDTVKAEVKVGIKEFLQEAAAKSGEKGGQREPDDTVVKAPTITKSDYVLGRPDAPVTMVIYTDIECPYCRRFHQTTLQAVRARFPDDLKIIYRHMPLPFHAPAAVNEAVMAECIGKAKGADGFYTFLNAAFASTRGNGEGFPESRPKILDDLIGAAKGCTDRRETLPKVEASASEAQALGVTGTPTIFLMRSGDERAFIFRGAVPVEMIVPRIEQLKQGTKG